MVSIKLQGGLANQMFMIAFLVSYAEKYGIDYCLPTTVLNPHVPGKSAYFFENLKYRHPYPDETLTLIKEKSFCFYEYERMDNVCFDGYFQSHKYFDEERIQKLFGFEWKDITDVCAVHVRRDDYLKWAEHHPPVSKEYLIYSMDFMFAFFGVTKFKFFSDDLQWCMDNFFNQFGEYEISYSDITDPLDDLKALSNHQFMIGSNSAFSLWGHTLNKNPNKFAIFPDKWFGPKLQHDTKDIYPPKSIQL